VTRPFLQLHTLTSYPASLLNRDDAGFAKRLPFGDGSRIRISSQCLKRHWRTFEGEGSLGSIESNGALVPKSLRSRRSFEARVLKPLVKGGVDRDLATEVTHELMKQVLGESPKAKAKKAKEEEEGSPEDELHARTGQITVLGEPELEFLLQQARTLCAEIENPKEAKKAVKQHFKGEAKKNLADLERGAGLSAALFGRMVTSDILARGDAAVHVAHAFTVNSESAEPDYFTAVDDLLSGEDDRELGSGHIGSTELTTGLFYGYVVVDLPLLVSNLEGCSRRDWLSADRELAAQVMERLAKIIATVSPGAKVGSTAPYSYAHWVLAEMGEAQPRSLANAFLKPVPVQGDLIDNTYKAVADHLSDLDTNYGAVEARRFTALGPVDSLAAALPSEQRVSLPSLADWIGGQVRRSDG